MASRRLSVVLELDTGRYSGRLSEAGAKMKVFSGSVTSASGSVKRLQHSFDTLNNRMASPLQKLRDYVLILGNIRLAILNVRDIAVGWVGSMLKQSMEVQRLTILMKGLSNATTEFGKNKEAEQNLTRLFKMARDNGFQVKELADAYIKLKTGGIDPMNGSLQSLTDAVAKFGGDSDVMHRASIAIQQMAGKGVISMEELRQQLGEAVPTAMWDMARAAGMSLQEFTKLVSKGKIQAKPALALMFQEFERMYSGSGKLIGQTLMGQVEQFKTNLTQLATSFTGMASGQTDNLKAYMDEQRELFAQGKITRDQFEAAMSGSGGGMFSGATEAMRELNEAMRSNDARMAMQELGGAINSVMQGLISTGRFIVEWRHQISAAIIGIVAAFTAVKAVQLGRWFVQLGLSATNAFTAAINISKPLPGAMGALEMRVRGVAESYTRLASVQALRVQRIRDEITGANQLQVASQRRIMTLNQQAQQYRMNLQLLAQQHAQELAELRTAQTLHQANLAAGRDATRSAMMVKAAQDNLNATKRTTMNVNRQLVMTEREVALAERQEAAAAATATAATGRLTIATTGATLAQRIMAASSRAAAVAVTFLGRAMNIALGPIGMIALALYAAAEAAGVFESKADAAAAAAARLMQGMADLEDMKRVVAQKQANADEFTRISDEINSGEEIVDGGTFRMKRKISPQRRAELMRKRQNLLDQNKGYNEALRRGASAITNDNINSAFGSWDTARENRFATMDQDYRSRVASGQINEKNSAAEAERLNRAKLGVYEAAVANETRQRDAMKAAGQDTTAQDRLIGKLVEARDAFKSMHQPIEQLQHDMIGAGKATGGAHHRLTDAEKAAKKAATAFENAREKYDRLIDGQKGEIASLEEQAAGGDNKGTARFEALKKAGFYADATNKELEEMAKNFARIDELNSQINFDKSLGSLRKELSKTATEATQMWNSLRSGKYEQQQRDAQYRSRFADLLEGLDPEKDAEKIAKINEMIDQVIGNIKSADAAEIANGWIKTAEEIEAGLLDENAARQRNFELEVERQRALIELTKAGTQERIDAEAAFERWRKAAALRLQRDNESGVIKMARDWAKLGTNIDTVFTNAASSLVDMLAEGEMNIGDFVTSVVKSLFKVILQAIIAYAILSAIGQTNGMSFSSFMQNGLKSFAGGFAQQPTKHTGGMIGGPGGATAMVGAHLWNNAPTRHGGGWIGGRALKKGEVPIVGMEKELVLTEEQQRLLGQQISGRGPAGGAPNVQVNVINNSGTELTAEQGHPEWNGKEMILSVVMEAANKQGPFRDMLQSAGKK